MKTTPTPVRIPEDLAAEIEEAVHLTKLSSQDVMRLAMRIGLVDLRASKHIAGILQKVATDKGQSFLAWASEQQSRENQNLSEVAAAAASPPIMDASPQQTKSAATAKIARLPRPITRTCEERKVADTPTEYKFTDRKKG